MTPQCDEADSELVNKSWSVPDRIFLLSQSERPEEIKKTLLDSAVSDGWIALLVNVHVAIFIGLIALTADFGAVNSLGFLAIQLLSTIIGSVIFLYLQLRRQSDRSVNSVRTEILLTVIDVLLMCSWGLGVGFFVSSLAYERSLMIIVLLAAAGITSAALNARLLLTLLLGRFVLFMPAIAYCLIEQPPFWGLLICTLLFSCGVSIGIGYAIHVQLLHEANLALKLRETSILLEQQSFSLERSLLFEQEAQNRILRETKLREQFLHSISHDLNQPLSALDLYLLDLGRQDIPRQYRASIDAAQRCLSSARSLIRSVSQLAWINEHLPQSKISPVKLQPLIDRVLDEAQSLAASKSLDIVRVPTSLEVWGDAEFLERALRNLVHNAIQYTDTGRVLVGVKKDQRSAIITVADTGPGIPKQKQELVFEAFYQMDPSESRRMGNVGLGLSIVKNLVSAMGGKLSLRSAEGKGAQFGIILPTVDTIFAKNCEPNLQADAGNPDLKVYEKVLLLEDSPEYRASIEEYLRELGYSADTAGTSEEFSQLDHHTLTQYRYLILDFDLGDGLTAFDILNQIEPDFLPTFLVISKHDDPEMVFHIKRKGGRFLRKPFSPDELEASLRLLKIKYGGNRSPPNPS